MILPLNFFSLCILGKQTRQREPIASTTASGCPHLSESRDCSINSCYSWRLEQQDECFLPREIGRDCGSGTRKLLFACVDFDGVSNFRIRLHQLHTYFSLQSGIQTQGLEILLNDQCLIHPMTFLLYNKAKIAVYAKKSIEKS